MSIQVQFREAKEKRCWADKKAFNKVFPKGICTFGSRSDDNQEDGDIELYIEVEDRGCEKSFEKL